MSPRSRSRSRSPPAAGSPPDPLAGPFFESGRVASKRRGGAPFCASSLLALSSFGFIVSSLSSALLPHETFLHQLRPLDLLDREVEVGGGRLRLALRRSGRGRRPQRHGLALRRRGVRPLLVVHRRSPARPQPAEGLQ